MVANTRDASRESLTLKSPRFFELFRSRGQGCVRHGVSGGRSTAECAVGVDRCTDDAVLRQISVTFAAASIFLRIRTIFYLENLDFFT